MTEPADIPRIKVLGARVPVLNLQEAVDVTEYLIDNPRAHCAHIVNTGFHGIWMGAESPDYQNVLNSAEFWVPDGISYSLIAKARGYNMKRIGGPEYVKEVLELSEEKGYSQFFYGDTPQTLEKLDERLKVMYPDLKIAGMYSPPFRSLSPEEDQQHVQMINDAHPDVLWVGLGCPKQEKWIAEHKNRLDVPVACGIGAIFSFLAAPSNVLPSRSRNSAWNGPGASHRNPKNAGVDASSTGLSSSAASEWNC